ncbi:MAG TPA: hypothetical protein VFZ89_10775 [Solirubrobacteraceae bacterium]
MSPAVVRSLVLLGAALAAAVMLSAQPQRKSAARASAGFALTAAEREGALRFMPGTHPSDADVVRRAIAAARPEARRLIDLADGAVTVAVGATTPGTSGNTRSGSEGFLVTLDLATVDRTLGPRGVSRLVMHELGHVVDLALLSPALRAQLDAEIPQGYPCAAAGDPSCAGRSAREERFAETFAKWATGDIGFGLEIGYRVLPPPSLDAWGAPLATVR